MKVIPKCNDYLYLHMKIDIFIEILNIVRGKAKVSIAILVFEFNSAA
jgi:hypothetical protein